MTLLTLATFKATMTFEPDHLGDLIDLGLDDLDGLDGLGGLGGLDSLGYLDVLENLEGI